MLAAEESMWVLLALIRVKFVLLEAAPALAGIIKLSDEASNVSDEKSAESVESESDMVEVCLVGSLGKRR